MAPRSNGPGDVAAASPSGCALQFMADAARSFFCRRIRLATDGNVDDDNDDDARLLEPLTAPTEWTSSGKLGTTNVVGVKSKTSSP